MNPNEWISELHWRTNNDYDTVIVIDGEEGSGKSNTGTQLALRLDPTFDPDTTIYNHEDWAKRPAHKQKNVLLIDEGGDLGFSRDWNVLANKELVKFMMVARQLNQTMIFCIPNIYWLDKYFREHRTRYRLHMTGRSRAIVQKRNYDWRRNVLSFKDEFSFRPTNMKQARPDFWAAYLVRKRAALSHRPQRSGGASPTVEAATPQADHPAGPSGSTPTAAAASP